MGCWLDIRGSALPSVGYALPELMFPFSNPTLGQHRAGHRAGRYLIGTPDGPSKHAEERSGCQRSTRCEIEVQEAIAE